jgi:hypothetical protein|tara:strand:- start:1199 stop:1510 length:312 start_codon:yes stop_codon:yes gene_type:complete
MKFRTGKYAGLTIEHVRKFDPKYIRWISENRPEMLRERINNPIKVNKPAKKYNDFEGLDIKSKANAIKPNYDFESEKPSPYLASPEEAFGMNFPTKKDKSKND